MKWNVDHGGKDETFFVTFTNDMPPIKTHGKDRLDALIRCGFTMWTEEEWNTDSMKETRKQIYGETDKT